MALLRPYVETINDTEVKSRRPASSSDGGIYHVDFVHWIHLQIVPPYCGFLDIFELRLYISMACPSTIFLG